MCPKVGRAAILRPLTSEMFLDDMFNLSMGVPQKTNIFSRLILFEKSKHLGPTRLDILFFPRWMLVVFYISKTRIPIFDHVC